MHARAEDIWFYHPSLQHKRKEPFHIINILYIHSITNFQAGIADHYPTVDRHMRETMRRLHQLIADKKHKSCKQGGFVHCKSGSVNVTPKWM